MSSEPAGRAPDEIDPLPRFAVVDLETSGLRAGQHRILQIGLVVVEIDVMDPDPDRSTAGRSPCSYRTRTLDTWSTMVRLRWPFQRTGPHRIHGIRRRHLRGAPRLADVLTELAARIDGAVFTAHNASFDADFLRRAAHHEGVSLELGPQVCTLRMSQHLDPDRTSSHRLVDLCERYRVDVTRSHDALADAVATASVLPHLLHAHGIEQRHQLERFYVGSPAGGAPAWSR